ncbi:DUF502 domain-containing protein [Solimonas sp. K1W22B-7]|uniref:DUF502 domain-containing protein n=1 Tax=Solimonas sp. K1W22B-7 TaxID=2303331 RepID=UPI000E333B37|nr:DUF502 domain-containing protein [Solimonas sp. K1W22B-7]
MRKFAGTFFTGLLAILPILVTVALVMWLVGAAESVLGGLLGFLLPRGLYLPGMGLLVAILLIYLVGLGMQGLFVQQAFGWLESGLNRIPLVKTVYGAVRDLTGFMSNKRERKFGQVVMVQLPNLPLRLVGFVTVDDLGEAGISGCDTGGCVAVYLPMSYQIGGYTVMLPRQHLTPMDMSFEEAMRFVITAGMSRPSEEAPRGGNPPAA